MRDALNNMKNRTLDKDLESIGYILDISQFDAYQSIYNEYRRTKDTFKLTLEEAILECGLNGFEQINLTKKDYLKSSLFKPRNILLIPYKHEHLGWYLSPWKILKITETGVMLNCMHVLFSSCFDDKNKGKSKGKLTHRKDLVCWKNSSLRSFLNSNDFLDNFPKAIQTDIDFHDVWTIKEVTKDRFWLLSWQELGELSACKWQEDAFKGTTSRFAPPYKNGILNFTIDYPEQDIKLYNSVVFKTIDDLIKYDISKEVKLHYWLRSSTLVFKTCMGCVGANGILNPYWDYDIPLGCSPVFILNNKV